MIAFLFIVALASIAVAAPVKPVLSDDFTADVVYHITRRHEPRRTFHGQIYSDNTGKRERFDAEVEHLGRIDVWKLWNSTKGGAEFEYSKERNQCHKNWFEQPFHGAFTFVANSHYASACDTEHKGARWTATVPGAFELDLCASEDGKTPYWLERKHLIEDHLHIAIRFDKYTPGRPAASFFDIPAVCPK